MHYKIDVYRESDMHVRVRAVGFVGNKAQRAHWVRVDVPEHVKLDDGGLALVLNAVAAELRAWLL